jgi:hypothetical protein
MLRLITVRLLPLILLTGAAGAWFNDVQGGGPYVLRNFVPLIIMLLFALITLLRGQGSWTGSGWRLPLGTLGFSIPTLGLALYLHYAYSVNLNGMFDAAESPLALFRFLPIYTTVAGGIGFAIGWIAGRNL